MKLSLLPLFICSIAIGQQLTVNTDKIESLIDQWNSVHNNRNASGLENIYDDQLVVFYAERAPRSKAILLKKLLFVRNPGFEQRISSDIKYTLHTNGIVKCDFTKDVFRNGEWQSIPSYLLVGFKKHSYLVIGEGEEPQDKELGFAPKIGEPMEVEILSASVKPKHNVYQAALENVTPEVTATRMLVPIDKVLIYALVFFLGTGGFFIFFRENFRHRKEKKEAEEIEEDIEVIYDEAEAEDMALRSEHGVSSAESYQVIENRLKQDAFRSYLLKLFDPMSFVQADGGKKDGTTTLRYADDVYLLFHFEIHGRNTAPITLSVLPMYHEDKPQINILHDTRVQQGVTSESLYFVVGIGGPPDSPSELYLVPESDVKPTMSKDELKPFRRSRAEVFSYSRDSRKLK